MWIKLADKRPAENGAYLCFCKGAGNPYMCVMRYTAQGTRIDLAMTPYRLNEDIWVVVHGNTTHMNKYITHWTTLPDAPGNAQQQVQPDSALLNYAIEATRK